MAQWVNARMPFPVEFGLYQAIGFHRDGRMVVGAVFNNYRKMLHGDSIDVTFATAGPGSLTPGALRALFVYPFGTERIVRLQALTAKSNQPARRLLEKLGFVREGSARRAWDGRETAILYGMERENCRWIARPKALAA